MAALPLHASAGLFGKLPSRGDFVREGLSRDFTDAWDAWWQRGLAATQLRPREEWHVEKISAKLACVFGCGGDRDAGKRSQMGAVAAAHADRIVVTSDNPRSEDPLAIAQAVTRGVIDARHRGWTIEIDRHAAIAAAIADASKDDVVLVAGKGHETYQERMGERVPFSDAEEAGAALAAWRQA